MRVVAIIQARMGSTRLPGKVMKDLGGATVLARVVNRTRRATRLDEVIVATSTAPRDQVIVDECGRLDVACFRGDENDVLDRYYQCARQFSADAVVRITSDCPLIDPELIDTTVERFLKEKPDYATNALPVSFPRGLDVEVLSAEALGRAWREAQQPYERVHVTPYFYEEKGRFRVVSISADGNYSHHRWTLDTHEDLQLIRSIYEQFGNRDDMGWRRVLDILEREPRLVTLNAHVRQKSMREG